MTGEKGPVQRTAPSLRQGRAGRAVQRAAALVSFNAPALCSYGQEQSRNAPTGRLRRLRLHHRAESPARRPGALSYRMGDATVVFWAKSGEAAYQERPSAALFRRRG
ncbi:MAG: type I-C CRISPR-associated protein Cas8c/Csd1 [Oscillospiraceae bacterium]